MSSFRRNIFASVAAALMLSQAAAAQLLPGMPLPSVSLPVPVGNVPIAGPALQDILAQPQAQQVIRPTLDTIAGLPEAIAESGPASLLDLRRLRLEALIRENRDQL